MRILNKALLIVAQVDRNYHNFFRNIVFNKFEEPGEKSLIKICRLLPLAAARLARTAHLPTIVF